MMNDEELKFKISTELDIKNLQDLTVIMNTVEGRRFFSWMIMRCGQNTTSFTRDSRTYFNEGMRNVALMLEGCLKATGLSGIDLMHKAEKDYVIYQEELKEQIISERGKK